MLSKNKGLKETPNYKLGIFFFCILVIIYMTLGIIFIVYSSNIQSYSVYYDDECGTASECSITIDVQETMEGPVYFYYSLDNFYQNHFEYINSVDFDQLQGREKPASELESCEPRILVRDSPNTIYNLNGEKMFSDDVLFPCGIIAETIFNDTFRMMDSNDNNITISEEGIAWETDIEKYKNLDGDYKSKQWIEIEDNEHLMVWMRLAGFSSFKKLWGIIEENLPQDKYTIIIQNNYQTSSASSEYHRGITITTLNDLGGRNYEVGILLIVFGLLSLFAMIFLVITWRVKVKKTKES